MNDDNKSDSLAELARDLHALNSRVPDDVANRLRTVRVPRLSVRHCVNS